jgi:hypothetical protein
MRIDLPAAKAAAGLALALSVAGLVQAGSASAVLEGRNGRIAFLSGREGPNDSMAQLYLRSVTSSTGSGALSEPFGIPGTQNRHPSWSPDRTKVVFAAGTPGAPTTEEFDLFVKDFVTGTITPLDGLQLGDGLSSDRPAWSPDGTKIAYEHQPVDNSADRNIMIKTYPSAQPAAPLATSPAAEFKPAWSPDSATVYYSKTQSGPPVNHDIVMQPATGGTETPLGGLTTAADEFQPSISPDGKRLCFTLQSTAGNNATADVHIATLPSLAGSVNISADATRGDYNCTWSPDGRKLAYASGVFSQGRLVMKNVDGSTLEPIVLEDDMGSNNFDGNPDWAPDGSPDCPDTTASTPAGTPVTIPLECTDTGPEYERTDPNGFVTNDGAPQHGTTSDDAPLAEPSTVRYTPEPGFTGTDTIVYSAFDDFGFGTDTGTVTITVTAPGGGGGNGGGGGGGGGAAPPTCAGRPATIVGTAGADTLVGTPGADVIVAGGGRDTVRALRGADAVCAGGGRDRVSGGTGADRLNGGGSRDRLSGGRGRDRIRGGRGVDTCAGGAGTDAVACERKR